MKKIISIILLIVAVFAAGCQKKREITVNTGLNEIDTIVKEDLCIGNIYYQQPISEVFASYGKPVYTRKGAPKGMCYKFICNGKEFEVSASADEKHSGEVMSMKIDKGIKLVTKAGIRIGSTYDEVVKVYGKPTYDSRRNSKMQNTKGYGISYRRRFHRNPKQYDYYCYLYFSFDKDNKVVSIKFGTVDMSA